MEILLASRKLKNILEGKLLLDTALKAKQDSPGSSMWCEFCYISKFYF